MGVPLALGGGFALTYTIDAGKKLAVRCFQRDSSHLETRYEKISAVIAKQTSGYFVGFEYQKDGILVDGQRYPIVKMEWAQGDTLGSFLEKNFGSASAIDKLRADFFTMEQNLRRAGIAHGDLQNGNVVISNGLKLIDYDGLFVPGLPIGKGFETGQKHFQHPKRSAADFGPEMDRFSYIVIDLSLQALASRPQLFDEYSNGQNIIFSASDYADPSSSKVFSALRAFPDLKQAAENLSNICSSAFRDIPTLEDFLVGKNIPKAAIKVTSTTASRKVVQEYIGAYDVIDASNYNAALSQVGNRVELIGKVLDVKEGRTRGRKPYIFVNFSDWRGNAVKLSIWSEGLKILRETPSAAWVGQYISVTGLIDPPFKKSTYSHVGITITEATQIKRISSEEALWRLGRATRTASNGGSEGRLTGNDAILSQLSPNRTSLRGSKGTSHKPTAASTTRSAQANAKILQQIGAGSSTRSSPTFPSTSKTSYGRAAPRQSSAGKYSPQQQPEKQSGTLTPILFLAFIIIVIWFANS